MGKLTPNNVKSTKSWMVGQFEINALKNTGGVFCSF